ncbi:hypothetical protein VM1G_11233 [Cytospora mali]|uniref:J domain-containing protein n=1 Tax=Cytospora mali TaxID=578113 RepID=A0A194VKE7_CYTMA|nr:hypothetical protein VM1G_11233 [Valsa mali]
MDPSPSKARADRAKRKAQPTNTAKARSKTPKTPATAPGDSDEPNPTGEPVSESDAGAETTQSKHKKKKKANIVSTHNGPYRFSLSNMGKTDTQISSEYPPEHPVWQNGADTIPRPKWMIHAYGPLPLGEKIKCTEPPGPSKVRNETEQQIEARMRKEWEESEIHVTGARNMFTWSTANLAAAFVIPYLGFPSTSALASFILTEGLEILGPFFSAFEKYMVKDSKFPVSAIVKAINQQYPDPYLMQILDNVRNTPDAQPLVQVQFLQTTIPSEPSVSGGVSIILTAVCYVYKLLCHMTKGSDWRPDIAEEEWQRAASSAKSCPLSRYGADLAPGKRFKYWDATTTDTTSKPVDVYLGYTAEDWNRAFVLFVYVKLQKEKACSLLTKKRAVDVHIQHWAGEAQTARRVKLQEHKKKEKLQEQAELLKLFKDLSRRARETSSDDEITVLAKLIEEAREKKQVPEYGKVREELSSSLARIKSYLMNAEPRRLSPNIRPVDVEELSSIWETISMYVRDLQGPVRNANSNEFQRNNHIANFVTKTSSLFVAESEAACQRVMDAIKDEDPDLQDSQVRAMADTQMKASYSLSTITSGKPPVEVSYEEALDAIQFPDYDGDRADLTFNRTNTSVTVEMSEMMSDARTAECASQSAPKDARGARVLKVPFKYFYHQPVDAYIVHVFLNSPLRCFILGNDMGVGKTIIFETAFHMHAAALQRQHEKGEAPKGQTYGPHLLVTLPILQDQSCGDFLKPFRGVRDYIIVNSTGRTTIPGASAISKDDEWLDLMDQLYHARFTPEVMNTTIIVSYGIMANRFIGKTTVFTLVDGEKEEGSSLPRRVKTTPSKGPWGKYQSMEAAHLQKKIKVPFPHGNLPTTPAASQASFDNGPSSPLTATPKTPKSFQEDSPGSSPGTTNPARSVGAAIKYILKGMRKGGNLDDSDGVVDFDADEADEPEHDNRTALLENIQGPKLLKLFFRARGIETAQGMLEFAAENPKKLPAYGEEHWRLTAKFFPLSMQKAGKTPIFEQLTFDEGHHVRNTDSTYHLAANLLPKRRLLVSTGTALYNSIEDVRGYSRLFADHTGIDKHFRYKSDEIDVMDYITWSEDVVDQGYVEVQHGADEEFVKALHHWANEDLDRRQWWCLLRGYRAKLATSDPVRAERAASAFLDTMVTTRKMKTPLQLPDGRVTFPSASLPPCETRTVEVSHNLNNSAKLALAIDVLSDRLYDDPDADQKDRTVQPDGFEYQAELTTKEKVEMILNVADAEQEKQMGMAYHRVMTLLGFDLRNHSLFFDPEVHRRDPLAKLSKREVDLLRDLSKKPDDELLPESRGEATARFGTADVRKLASMDIYGGLFWKYSLLAGPDLVPYDNVIHMLVWALAESPVMFETINRVINSIQNKKKYGGRSLILIDSPFAQLALAGILRYLGLSVQSYTSDLKEDERAQMIANFNNPNTNIDVMILSLSFNVTGMNLQKACHNGICTMYYFNPSQMKQAMARLNRIGQPHIVYWFIIKQLCSYAEMQERTIHTKEVSFYSAQSLIPRWLGDELRTLICFELAREAWGTLESKYVVTKYACLLESVRDWSQPWVRRYAKYYSIVASLALQCLRDDMSADEQVEETSEKRYVDVDRRFNPFTITWDMVEQARDGYMEMMQHMGLQSLDDIIAKLEEKLESMHPSAGSRAWALDVRFAPPEMPRPDDAEMRDIGDEEEADGEPGEDDESEVNPDERPGQDTNPPDDHLGFYRTLGVHPSDSGRAIRTAFRKLSLRLHPDKNPSPNANEEFRRVLEAYEVLSLEDEPEEPQEPGPQDEPEQPGEPEVPPSDTDLERWTPSEEELLRNLADQTGRVEEVPDSQPLPSSRRSSPQTRPPSPGKKRGHPEPDTDTNPFSDFDDQPPPKRTRQQADDDYDERMRGFIERVRAMEALKVADLNKLIRIEGVRCSATKKADKQRRMRRHFASLYNVHNLESGVDGTDEVEGDDEDTDMEE